MSWIKVSLIVLGCIALLAMAVPELGMIAAISIIGLPIAVMLWAAPALFFILAVSYAIYKFLPIRGKAGAALAVLLCGVVLAVPVFSSIHGLKTQRAVMLQTIEMI